MSYLDRLKEELKIINLPNIAYAVGAVSLFSLLIFLILLSVNGRKTALAAWPEPKYDTTELSVVEAELSKKGYTRNIDPYFNYVRSKLLTRKVLIIKYKLRKNDSLWTIKSRFRVSMNTVVGANPYLKSLEGTMLGQEVIVLNKSGILHRVKQGDTLDSIAAAYGVKKEFILENNELASKTPGEVFLYIPGVEPLDLTPEMKEQP